MSEILLSYNRRPTTFDKDLAKDRQNKYIKNELISSQKMELYDCGVKGDLNNLKNIVENKKYNLSEECSANGYYWTVMHYASHYGYVDIIKYVVNHYKDNPNKLEILNIQSNIGMSPLMIAVNNIGDENKKKNILKIFVDNNIIDFSICSVKGEDIISICNKYNLLDYLYSLLKED